MGGDALNPFTSPPAKAMFKLLLLSSPGLHCTLAAERSQQQWPWRAMSATWASRPSSPYVVSTANSVFRVSCVAFFVFCSFVVLSSLLRLSLGARICLDPVHFFPVKSLKGGRDFGMYKSSPAVHTESGFSKF